MKFKIGDRVRVVKAKNPGGEDYSYLNGETCTITGVQEEGPYPYDTDLKDRGGALLGFDDTELEHECNKLNKLKEQLLGRK